MKLFYSPASPYARKCRVVAIEKGMGDRVELITASPMANPADLLAANPLGKIPALLLADGRPIFDSPVICHYLDSLSDTPRLIPSAPEARLDTLMREALGDGIMDAALPMVQEGRRPEAQRSPDWLERWAAAIRRSVAYANARVRPIGQPDVGDIRSPARSAISTSACRISGGGLTRRPCTRGTIRCCSAPASPIRSPLDLSERPLNMAARAL